MVWQAMAAGLAAGYLKNKLIDEPKEQQNRLLQAEIMRYSPWTGMRPDSIAPDTPAASSMLEGAATGLSYGMGERDKANARADKLAEMALANPGSVQAAQPAQAAAAPMPLTKEQAYMQRQPNMSQMAEPNMSRMPNGLHWLDMPYGR